MITNNKYIIHNGNYNFASLSDKKLMYDFAKELYFDVKATGNKFIRDTSLIRLYKLPAVMVAGFSTIFLPEDPDELCDRLKLLLQKNKLEKIQT